MQHTVEDISPVKKKIAVTVPANEVDAILDRTVRQYRSRVTLPGFRMGKAPMAMVEKRFTRDIYGDAFNELLNANIDEILREIDVKPLGDLSFEDNDTPLIRGKDFSYAFSFELMPQMTLPRYEGIGVEEDEPTVEDSEIDEVIERLRRGMAKLEDIAERRLARDGDVAVVDFAGFDERGEAVEGVSGENFRIAIGDGQVIPDFEALVKTVLPGESGEGPVHFPDDYGHAPLAGKTVTMKMTVNRLQTRTFPAIDDEFAKNLGEFDSCQAMRDSIRTAYMRDRKNMARTKAQKLLLDKLLAQTDFPLPEDTVARYAENLMHGRLEDLARLGGELPPLEADELTKMREKARTDAEEYARGRLFLITAAQREGLEVTPQEMTAELRQIAERSGQTLKEVQERYSRNNLLPVVHERILADKAMDVLYDKAALKKADEQEDGGAQDVVTENPAAAPGSEAAPE